MFGVCSYFILEQDKLIIIDPGKLDDNVFEWLNKFKNFSKIVYITHEHFDHHYDANKVFELEKTYFFSPCENFNVVIKDVSKNLSYYYNDPIETVVKFNTVISDLKIIKTPGHSKESYCFVYDNLLFGGDTVIERKYLVFKLPGGNRNDFNYSISKIKDNIDLNTIVLPGHGDLFYFDEWVI